MNNIKLYSTEKIYLGYTIKLNNNPVDAKTAFRKEVIAMKKVSREKEEDFYMPINDEGYYLLEKVVPIKEKQKKKSTLITHAGIKRIVESENI